jgi:hypothetical protein
MQIADNDCVHFMQSESYSNPALAALKAYNISFKASYSSVEPSL